MSELAEAVLAWIDDQRQLLPEHRTPAAHGKAELLRDLRAVLAAHAPPAAADDGGWHHARWFDHHPPKPADEGTPSRPSPGNLATSCLTCGEVLLRPIPAAVDRDTPTDTTTTTDLAKVLDEWVIIGVRSEHDPGCPGGGDYCSAHCPVPVQYDLSTDEAAAVLAPVVATARAEERERIAQAIGKAARSPKGERAEAVAQGMGFAARIARGDQP